MNPEYKMASQIDVLSIKALSWSTTTTYTPSSIITYAISLGVSGTNLPRVFEGSPTFAAPPTFGTLPVIAIMGAVTQSMAKFLPGFQPHNHVHGEHFMQLSRPFPAKGATLKTTAKIVDLVDRRSGVTVAVGITTTNADTNDQICYNEWTSFIMKVPGSGLSSTPIPRGAATANYPAPKRSPDKSVEYKTSPEQGALYRASSGDLNPLHIDPAVAKAGGFPGPILTGTCTLGMGVLHVLDTFADGDYDRFESVKVRLSKPVFPGEVVRTEMWDEGKGRILFRIVVPGGDGGKDRVVMSNAVVELKNGASAKI